jgi:hypothetical protein
MRSGVYRDLRLQMRGYALIWRHCSPKRLRERGELVRRAGFFRDMARAYAHAYGTEGK